MGVLFFAGGACLYIFVLFFKNLVSSQQFPFWKFFDMKFPPNSKMGT
jgi:hypothetical protein